MTDQISGSNEDAQNNSVDADETTAITIVAETDRLAEYVEHVVLPDLANGNTSGYTDQLNHWGPLDEGVPGAFTVIGFWYGDEPMVAGVIEGHHNVDCGMQLTMESDFNGPWAHQLQADDANQAERHAIEHMLTTRPADDEGPGEHEHEFTIDEGDDPTTGATIYGCEVEGCDAEIVGADDTDGSGRS